MSIFSKTFHLFYILNFRNRTASCPGGGGEGGGSGGFLGNHETEQKNDLLYEPDGVMIKNEANQE